MGPLRRAADLKRIGGWIGAPNTCVLSWCGTKLLAFVGGPAGCRTRLTDGCGAGAWGGMAPALPEVAPSRAAATIMLYFMKETSVGAGDQPGQGATTILPYVKWPLVRVGIEL